MLGSLANWNNNWSGRSMRHHIAIRDPGNVQIEAKRTSFGCRRRSTRWQNGSFFLPHWQSFSRSHNVCASPYQSLLHSEVAASVCWASRPLTIQVSNAAPNCLADLEPCCSREKIRESALSSPGPSTLQMTLMVLFHPRWFLGFCSDPNEVSAGCFAVIYWEGSSFILWFEGSSSADQIQGHPLKANDHEWSQERLQTLQFPYQMDRFFRNFWSVRTPQPVGLLQRPKRPRAGHYLRWSRQQFNSVSG